MQHMLIIAGLDPSGGAGFLADAAIARAHGLRPAGAITALTVQDTAGVRGVEPVSAEIIGDQLAALFSDLELAAVKIGMLGDEAIAQAIGKALAQTSAPVVWDPVLCSTRGKVALYRGRVDAALAALAPHLALITPNVAEAAALSGRAVESAADLAAAAAVIAEASGAAVLAKGGHLGGEEAADCLVAGGETTWLRAARQVGGEDVHGTGCALATTAACALAQGASIVEAARAAKAFVAERIAGAQKPGRGAPAIV